MQLTDDKKRLLMVTLPDTRGVTLNPWMQGNLKIGPTVYTYSRLAGKYTLMGTCPGSTPECEEICYAKRIDGIVAMEYLKNSRTSMVPEIPEDAKLIRIHISGDFDSVQYINNWCQRLQERPDVTVWAYTRSWRVKELLAPLERLRAMPNMQLFASMDVSAEDMPPTGWRIAWIDGDPRAGFVHGTVAHLDDQSILPWEVQRTASGTKALICPEETKDVVNCESCGFCFDGKRNDVIFLKH